MNHTLTSAISKFEINQNQTTMRIRVAMTLLLAFVFSVPILSVLASLFVPNQEIWQHLSATLLPTYIKNSFWLALGVGIITVVLGVSSAWLVTMCQFPGSRWLSFALLLPMAIPAYIIAYTYTGIFDISGPFQFWIRQTFNLQYGEYWFPEIRSLGGAIIVMSLVLYPYVYLISRAAMLEQSICTLEVARTLGCNAWKMFFSIAVPLIRPAIIVGLSLVLMETLADYGTVQYFGVPVFTTGIFRTWFGLDSLLGAAQLSSILLCFVMVLLLLEYYSRKNKRYTHTSNKYSSITKFQLNSIQSTLAFLYCLTILVLGFILPVSFLLYWSVLTYANIINTEFILLIWNSFILASTTAVLAIGFALLVCYTRRRYTTVLTFTVSRFLGMGYALPGTIIAVGVMVTFAWFDQNISQYISQSLGVDSVMLLSGSMFALVFAYLVRFLSVSINTLDSALLKVKPSMDEAAATHGYGPFSIIRQIHLPLIRSSLLTALLLVFVDVLKELPATLMLRPFNFNTLAVKTYELANEERLIEAASPALAIVLTGLIPVIILSMSIAKSRPGNDVTS